MKTLVRNEQKILKKKSFFVGTLEATVEKNIIRIRNLVVLIREFGSLSKPSGPEQRVVPASNHVTPAISKSFEFIGVTRVVDPYSFFTDPDPELDVGGQYGSGSNTDPGL